MDDDRRKDKRVREDFGILCKIYTKTELESNISKIIDLSKSGLSFIAEEELAKNDILHFMFRVPPDFKEKIELFGRIVDCENIEENRFKIRVAFIDISDEAKSILNKNIEQAGP